MQIYEYYDGYEDFWPKRKKHRPKVQYIVLGDLIPDRIVICYLNIETNNFLAPLHIHIHKKAWSVNILDKKEASISIQNAIKNYRDTIESLEKKINNTIQNKEKLDAENNIKSEGYSSSSGDSSYTIILKYGDSYSEKYIEAMQKRINILQIAKSALLQVL